eukprot:gene33395-29359_t
MGDDFDPWEQYSQYSAWKDPGRLDPWEQYSVWKDQDDSKSPKKKQHIFYDGRGNIIPGKGKGASLASKQAIKVAIVVVKKNKAQKKAEKKPVKKKSPTKKLCSSCV